MKTVVLFIQGGGQGAYEMDAVLAAALQDALGADFSVMYPRMPREDDPDYVSLWFIKDLDDFQATQMNGQ